MTDATFSPPVMDSIAIARRHAYGDLLHRSATRHPDKLAVVMEDRRVTFAEFDVAANRCARTLFAKGLSKGDRLALLSHNCWEYALLAFATARIGVVLVPINFMLGEEEVAFILSHSGAKGLVVEEALVAVGEKALGATSATDPVRGVIAAPAGREPPGWESVEPWWREGDPSAPEADVRDDDPLRLMYTSGTESRPKGVMLPSRSLIAQYVSCIVDGGMSPEDVELHCMPMYHCAQLDCFFSPDVYLGATSIIMRMPDPAAMLATIERERVTKLFCPPTIWIALLASPDFDLRDLSSLRKIYYGAAPMPVEVLRELQERLPGAQLWNFYGQTEMSPVATILRPDEQLAHAGSAGRPGLNVETLIVDKDDKPVPPGMLGEIVHRSPHASLGYYNDEARTREAFRHGWFHSGDLGIMTEDGYLSVVDRKKDMIKTGGENVASREVEEALYELDGVAEAAVFGIPHPYWIEAVTAVVVPRPGAILTAEGVQDYVRGRLAGYKRPKYIAIVDALPRNPSGKILKRELRDQYAHMASQ